MSGAVAPEDSYNMKAYGVYKFSTWYEEQLKKQMAPIPLASMQLPTQVNSDFWAHRQARQVIKSWKTQEREEQQPSLNSCSVIRSKGIPAQFLIFRKSPARLDGITTKEAATEGIITASEVSSLLGLKWMTQYGDRYLVERRDKGSPANDHVTSYHMGTVS
jgi:hypothetical protein